MELENVVAKVPEHIVVEQGAKAAPLTTRLPKPTPEEAGNHWARYVGKKFMSSRWQRNWPGSTLRRYVPTTAWGW
jgi:hypothetical protein